MSEGDSLESGVDLKKWIVAQRSMGLLGRAIKSFKSRFCKGTAVSLGRAPKEVKHKESLGPVRINNHSYVWR